MHHIALIHGSDREGRFCDVVAGWALAQLRRHPEIRTEVIDPLAHDHPPRTGHETAGLQRVRQQLESLQVRITEAIEREIERTMRPEIGVVAHVELLEERRQIPDDVLHVHFDAVHERPALRAPGVGEGRQRGTWPAHYINLARAADCIRRGALPCLRHDRHHVEHPVGPGRRRPGRPGHHEPARRRFSIGTLRLRGTISDMENERTSVATTVGVRADRFLLVLLGLIGGTRARMSSIPVMRARSTGR